MKEALPADEGFGAGGGGGSFSQSGGASSGGAASKGGCGTVILRFSKTDLSTLLFEVDPIPDQYFTGSAQTPAVVVRHVIGGTVVDPANYDVTYADNVNPGTARVTVAGKGAYDGIRAFGSFVISSMVRDEYLRRRCRWRRRSDAAWWLAHALFRTVAHHQCRRRRQQ